MAERDFENWAANMRSTGSVRFFTSDLAPKTAMNTGPEDIARQILNSVLSTYPEKFQKDSRPEREEVRYHWRELPDEDKIKILKLCFQGIEQNEIANERGWRQVVFESIYRHLNTIVT